MSELLRVSDLRVSYGGRGGEVPAVEGAGLVVGRGETVAVVGESGSGKSTLAASVIGLLPRSARVHGGEISFKGESLLTAGERRMRSLRGRSIALVPQNPMASLNPVLPVGVQVEETLRLHGLASGAAARRRATALLRTAGMADAEARSRCYPHELSGGLCQRVLIAIALAGEPELIIADEPTSALDTSVQRRILDHFAVLTEESGTAVLLITHDLSVAAERAQRVVVMSGGRTVEDGPAAQLLTAPRHARTRRLVADAPGLGSGRLRPAAPTGTATAPKPAPQRTDALLRAEGLTKVYRDRRAGRDVRAVDEVDLAVGRGETLALVGESGSGKSTTARLLLGLVRPTSGSVLFDGTDVGALDRAGLRAFRRRTQLVFQDPFGSLDPRMSVADLVEEPLRAHRTGSRAERAARVRRLLDHVALDRRVSRRRPAELSGGQCQRVAIARAIALGPELVVCDEPVSALDVSVQAQILRLLAGLQAELGLSYLFISHDLAVVRQMADRVAVMRSGRIVETGAADEVLTAPKDPYTRMLVDAVPRPARSRPGGVTPARAGSPRPTADRSQRPAPPSPPDPSHAGG